MAFRRSGVRIPSPPLQWACRDREARQAFFVSKLETAGGRSKATLMAKHRPRRKAMTAEDALIAANKDILFHYPTMFTGRSPRRLSLPNAELWIVPIVFTHADHGLVGDVGYIALHGYTGEVVGRTPREEVVAAGSRLRMAKGYALETSVLSPGAV